MSKFDRAEFFIFILVFVSREFQIGRNVSCNRLHMDCQSRMGLIY